MGCEHTTGHDRPAAVRDAGSLPRIVLAGRPGAGKGTQGTRLARRLRVQYLSTGDVLREEIASGSPLGSAVERLVNSGRLVPTGLIVAVVQTHLGDRGYLLDGFPRTVAQAKALFDRNALAPSVAIEIVVPTNVAVERLTARGRADDAPSVARERLVTYETETIDALDWLDRRGLLIRIDGDALPDVVETRVWLALTNHMQGAGTSPRDNPFYSADAHPTAETRAHPDLRVVR